MTQSRIRAHVHPGFELGHRLVPAGSQPGPVRLAMGRRTHQGDTDEIEARLPRDGLDLVRELPALREHCGWCHGSLQSLVRCRHVASLYTRREALYDVLQSLPI